MSLDVMLLGLRLVGAVLLLSFMGTLAWLLYRDLRTTSALLAQKSRPLGFVRLMQQPQDEAPTESLRPLFPITSIGRAPTNLIVIPDTYASSDHALIVRRGEQWWLEDLGSRNGTLLNDVRLTETAVVSPGDVITIGSTRLKIEPEA